MAVYVISFGVTDTGLTLNASNFVVFAKTAGGSPTNAAPATVTAIGYGLYKFTYVAAEDVAFVVDGGAGVAAADRYVRGVLSPADTRLDVAISTVASDVAGLATQAGLDAVNGNVAILDARVQTQQDAINRLTSFTEGRWKIYTTGADANRIVYFSQDGTTVLAKFDLKDVSGNATYKSAFERVPV